MSPPIACSVMTFAAWRETRNEPRAITSCCRSQSARVVSSSGLEMDRPALLTTRATPPEASAAAPHAAAHAPRGPHGALVGPVRGPRRRDVPRAQLVSNRPGRVGVAVGHDHAGALGGEPLSGGPADSGTAPGDQRDPSGQRLPRRAAAGPWLL